MILCVTLPLGLLGRVLCSWASQPQIMSLTHSIHYNLPRPGHSVIAQDRLGQFSLLLSGILQFPELLQDFMAQINLLLITPSQLQTLKFLLSLTNLCLFVYIIFSKICQHPFTRYLHSYLTVLKSLYFFISDHFSRGTMKTFRLHFVDIVVVKPVLGE